MLVARPLYQKTDTLKLMVTHAFNIPHADYTRDTGEAAAAKEPIGWTLLISGSLGNDNAAWTSVVKRLTVVWGDEATSYASDANTAQWYPQQLPLPSYEVRRIGSCDVNVKIFVIVDHQPPRFSVSTQRAYSAFTERASCLKS
jgi:hypothetical protein